MSDKDVTNEFSNSLQIIKFGSPGTGKSFSINSTIREHDCRKGLPPKNDPNIIRTVFHPDYSYGDFTAKLVPISVGESGSKKVEYQIHTGPFVKALAKAMASPCDNIYLIIEEINRGNTAAIFGDIFQLLDRDKDGESEYPISPAHLLIEGLQQELDKLKSEVQLTDTIVIPSNLSLIATMNTSDESVFYMDSAFKRRWHFEYIDVDADTKEYDAIEDNKKSKHQLHGQIAAKIEDYDCTWNQLRTKINKFIKDNKNSIRRIEDKLIGLWFIKAKNGKISKDEITNKLMHYLWDNVFARDKSPLITKLNGVELHTFGDFVKQVDQFLDSFKVE
ncbi:MAG: restriction endonuclease [Gammaproteobacteria bacterium]|nr:restriction endonuclease [Gammaproteobacteria bacterium]